MFPAGAPAEVYYFGTIYLLIVVGWAFVIIISALIFIPFFRKHDNISVYAVSMTTPVCMQ